MSKGLLDQLHVYFSDIDANQGSVTPEQVNDLLHRVRELSPNPMPDPGLDSAQARSEPEMRRGPMSIDERPTGEPPKTEAAKTAGRPRGFVVAAGIAAVVLIVGVGSWALFATDETQFGADDAMSVTDAYFDEYNAGNYEAVVALLTQDATVTWFGRSRADWEMTTAFFAGQGTILSPAECTVTEEVLGVSATVLCRFETFDGLVQAVGALPIPTTFIAVVTPDGVDRLAFSHGQPDFLNAAVPFERWIAENHPDAIEATTLWDWATLEEARQTGLVRAQFAEEWAIYLEENDCTFLDGC